VAKSDADNKSKSRRANAAAALDRPGKF